MKTFTNLLVILFVVTSIIGCKSKQNITKATSSTEINVPFSENKYKTDKNFFRAVQSGTSPDMATAKKIALVNAKSELASSIQTTIKVVTDNYTNQRSIANKQDFENKFEELSRQVTNQMLTNVVIMDEKMLKDENGKHTSWIAIEMSKDEVLSNLTDQVSTEKKLQIDFDKYQYEKIFNQEMEKFNNSQNQ
jgi:hypothetical protein